MTNNNDPFAPKEQIYTYFGEFVIYRWFRGTWLKGEQQPVEYDKNEGHTWNKIYFEFCFYPEGFDADYTQYVTNDSKEWKLFHSTLQGCLKDKSVSQVLQSCIDDQKSLFLQWEKRPVRKYTNKNGDEKDVYGYAITEIFESKDEKDAAYEAHKNNAPIPEGSKVEEKKVEPMPKEQALQFVASLAKQIPDTVDCWNELQKKLDEFPMLGGLKTDDEAVQKAAMDASEVFKVPF